MHKGSLLTRFLLLLTCSVLLFGMGTFLLTSYFSDSSYSAARQAELLSAHGAGQKLFRTWREGSISLHDLNVQLNPVLNTADAFWALYDARGQIIAVSDNAMIFLKDSEDKLRQIMDSAVGESILAFNLSRDKHTEALVLLEKTYDGYILTGIPGSLYSEAASALRRRMLVAFPILIGIILCVSLLLTRSGTRSVRTLTDAASRIREGESYTLPENMPAEAGQIAQTFNYMTDAIRKVIADLKREKETMTLVLEGLSEGILAADADGGLLHRNRACLTLLGEEDSECYQAVWQKVIQGATGVYKQQRHDSTLQFSVTPLAGEQNAPDGYVALIRDITEQELLERTRHDYVANISHELRTPLASIRGLAEGLRDDIVTKDADRKRYYTIIYDESNRLSRLVNDLLELSGLQSNPAAFETEKVDPVELIYDLCDRNGSLFDKAGIVLKQELSQEDLPCIRSNEDRLSQVLTIFLDNARKYTEPGGTVTLGAEMTEEGIRFYVRDTGIGMDEENAQHAFDRFYQAEKSRAGKGSGLGLAIAQEVMQKLGSAIHLTTAPGKGSEFSFTIAAM